MMQKGSRSTSGESNKDPRVPTLHQAEVATLHHTDLISQISTNPMSTKVIFCVREAVENIDHNKSITENDSVTCRYLSKK